jgi:hypothetical protein
MTMNKEKNDIADLAHKGHVRSAGHDSTTVSGASKLDEIAAVLSRKEVLALGNEHHLFVHLLVVADGSVTGSPEQLGREFATDGRNVKNWISKLEKDGIARVEAMEHRQMRITLSEPYLRVAVVKDEPTGQATTQLANDVELEKLITIYHTAKTTGQTLDISTATRIDCGRPSKN